MIRKWELNDGRIMQIEQDLDIVNKEFGAIVWDCALYVNDDQCKIDLFQYNYNF